MSSPPSLPARRLVYLANIRIPSERAHVLQIFKNCEAFARQGLRVELIHPGRRSEEQDPTFDCFTYYGVEPCFELREARVPDLIGLGLPGLLDRGAFLLHSASFLVATLRRGLGGALVYTRDLMAATLLAILRRQFVLELHTLPEGVGARLWLRYMSRRAIAIVLISKHLAEDYARTGACGDVAVVAPDGVDRKIAEAEPPERGHARTVLGFATDVPIAAYAGHLYAWKGVTTLLECAKELPQILFVIVGGLSHDVDRLVAKRNELGLDNVRIEGYVPPSQVSDYLAAADVLLLPNSGHTALSSRHTSPLKAFEYMAAGRAIVGSDLPSIREILDNGTHALLVNPDDGAAMAAAIRRLLRTPELASTLSNNARAKVRTCTWDNRAAVITDFVRHRGGFPPSGTATSLA